jgi:hypothetical protein
MDDLHWPDAYRVTFDDDDGVEVIAWWCSECSVVVPGGGHAACSGGDTLGTA